MTHHILLTFDIEDWFQVENFKECIPFSSWSSCELRVEKNTHRLLDLIDSIEVKRSEVRGQRSEVGTVYSRTNIEYPVSSIKYQVSSRPKATFFVLGWIAKRIPILVREIHSRGHEVASHGYYHELCSECTIKDLRKDLTDSKKLLEDIIGDQIYGYRAPSFSINNEILKTIEDCGYHYDSSFNSFAMHKRYGKLSLSDNADNGIARKISGTFYELPISNFKLGNLVLPWGGGGYFRLIPLSVFRLGVGSILRKEKSYLFYMHPWEVDPEQPKVRQASASLRFRHYLNLKKTYVRLSKLLQAFDKYKFSGCYDYIKGLA